MARIINYRYCVFAFFLCGCFLTSVANADSYIDGYRVDPSDSHLSSTPEAACAYYGKKVNQPDTYVDTSRYLCYFRPFSQDGNVFGFSGLYYMPHHVDSCSNGVITGTNQCKPKLVCPDSGTTGSAYTLIDLKSKVTPSISVGGCSASVTKLLPYSSPDTLSCVQLVDGSGSWCHVSITYDGKSASDAVSKAESKSDSFDDKVTSNADTRKNTSSTNNTTQPPVTNSDGSVTTKDTNTTTTISDAGNVITSGGDVTTITKSDGTKVVYTDTSITTTYPDGSKTVVNDKATATTKGGSTSVSINNNNPQESQPVSIPSGKTKTIKTTTTTHYNSSGGVESSDSTTSTTGGNGKGSVDGKGDDDSDKPAFCDYAKSVCSFMDWFKADGKYPTDGNDVPTTNIDLSQAHYDSNISVGQCPATQVIQLNIAKYSISVPINWSYLCQLAETINPVIVAFSWVLGLMIVMRA